MNDGLFNQPESAADDELIIGTVLAQRYEILEVLGKGGMGTVYRAQNRINGQIRAIKILHRRLISDPMSRQRWIILTS
jgi:serine/threonine protein kinase